MEISIHQKYGSTELLFEAENVKVVETISESIYGLKEDGKKDFTNRKGEDITDEAMSQLTRLMEDVFFYRNRDFDSSGLIEEAFKKLPQEKSQQLLEKLMSEYQVAEENSK